MIITKDKLNEKVPKDMIPKRLDSATDLYINTSKGLLLYNINPTTWNVLYPFFQQKNKFLIEDFSFTNKDITYQELINIYQKIYNNEYVIKQGFNEDKRKAVLIKEFEETFNICDVKISQKLDSHYELKYSKSKNVYTLYYLESYIVSSIGNINALLKQTKYQQDFLDLNNIENLQKLNGIKLVDSLSILLDNNKLDIVKQNTLDN